MSVFDIGDAAAFFGSITQVYQKYCSGKTRSTEDILFVIMGLNHLREWIAPNFKMLPNGSRPKAISPGELFSKTIFETPEHNQVRHICNCTKHSGPTSTSTLHHSTIDEWPDVDSVKDFDLGPPTAHLLDQKQIEVVLDPLVALYAAWFAGAWNPPKIVP